MILDVYQNSGQISTILRKIPGSQAKLIRTTARPTAN